jgi:hypothetical protein
VHECLSTRDALAAESLPESPDATQRGVGMLRFESTSQYTAAYPNNPYPPPPYIDWVAIYLQLDDDVRVVVTADFLPDSLFTDLPGDTIGNIIVSPYPGTGYVEVLAVDVTRSYARRLRNSLDASTVQQVRDWLLADGQPVPMPLES